MAKENVRYNTIVMSKSDFDNEKEFKEKVVDMLDLLCNLGYVAVVQIDDYDIYRIDFDYKESKDYGNPLPIWLSYEEQCKLFADREATNEVKDTNEEAE